MYRSDISPGKFYRGARALSRRPGRARRAGAVGAGASLNTVSFRPQAVRGGPAGAELPGHIDYRLARNAVVAEFRRGRLSRPDVCDAHPELVRAASGAGMATTEPCPICTERDLVHVSYAFGARLGPGGQVFAGARELDRVLRRTSPVTCYTVEVCPECGWNHLTRTYVAARRRPPGPISRK